MAYYARTPAIPDRYRDIQSSVTELDAGTEPLSLSDVKSHLRVEHSGDNVELTNLMSAARSACESLCHRTIRVNRQLRMSFLRWPVSRQIELPYPPLISVDSVQYIAEDGSPVVVDPSQYVVTTSQRGPGYIQYPDSLNWYDEPNASRRRDRFQIDFKVGYTGTAEVPMDLIHAIKVQCDLLWDHDAQPRILETYQRTLESLLGNWDPGSYA